MCEDLRRTVPPQDWGVSTKSLTGDVYLHVLDGSKADADGWLTLTGTAEAPGEKLTHVGDDAMVEWRRDGSGQIHVKRAWDREAIDGILRGEVGGKIRPNEANSVDQL
jgi:hypothetical protein